MANRFGYDGIVEYMGNVGYPYIKEYIFPKMQVEFICAISNYEFSAYT
jgi:hypothetical protein